MQRCSLPLSRSLLGFRGLTSVVQSCVPRAVHGARLRASTNRERAAQLVAARPRITHSAICLQTRLSSIGRPLLYHYLLLTKLGISVASLIRSMLPEGHRATQHVVPCDVVLWSVDRRRLGITKYALALLSARLKERVPARLLPGRCDPRVWLCCVTTGLRSRCPQGPSGVVSGGVLKCAACLRFCCPLTLFDRLSVLRQMFRLVCELIGTNMAVHLQPCPSSNRETTREMTSSAATSRVPRPPDSDFPPKSVRIALNFFQTDAWGTSFCANMGVSSRRATTLPLQSPALTRLSAFRANQDGRSELGRSWRPWGGCMEVDVLARPSFRPRMGSSN